MSKSLYALAPGLVAAIATLPLSAQAETSDISVVLVHGAFSDGSAWRKVLPILQEAGVSVNAAQLPLSSLTEDASAVSRLVEMQGVPVVLAGHSYGGNVITEASGSEAVEALVYVAGFSVDTGQAPTDLLKGQPPAAWQAEAKPDAVGYVRLSADGIAKFIAPDLPEEEAALFAAIQSPIQFKINCEAPTVAGWSMHPTCYVLAENDQIIPPKLQYYFARKMGAEVTKVATSHVAMLADPQAVAEAILQAIEASDAD